MLIPCFALWLDYSRASAKYPLELEQVEKIEKTQLTVKDLALKSSPPPPSPPPPFFF